MQSEQHWQELVAGIEFERQSVVKRAVKAVIVNPLANYLPAGMLKSLLAWSKSELAHSNWADPGGWRSMVISYDGKPRQVADKILVGAGTMAMALRNRRKLGSAVLAELIEQCQSPSVHVLCLGAGPGHIITDAMSQTRRHCQTTLVDINPDAFEYGRHVARQKGHEPNVRFIHCDIREASTYLDRPVDIVKLLGICEYLSDEQLTGIAGALAQIMPPGAPVVLNTLTKRHGTDRFFRRVFGLHMIHRDKARLAGLLEPAGFGDWHWMTEPLGVYDVGIGYRKKPN